MFNYKIPVFAPTNSPSNMLCARTRPDLVCSHSLLRVDRPLARGIAESLHAKAGAVLCAVDTLLQLLRVDAVIRVSGSVRCAHHGTHNTTQICFNQYIRLDQLSLTLGADHDTESQSCQVEPRY